MDKVVIYASIFVILIGGGVSDAFRLPNFRYLADSVDAKPKPNEVSPSPSPLSPVKGDKTGLSVSNPNQTDGSKAKNKTQIPPGSGNSSDSSKTPHGSPSKKHLEKDNLPPENSPVYEKCGASTSSTCTDGKNLSACLRHQTNGVQELFLLVENDGENDLTVNITAPATVQLNVGKLQVAKHHTEKIDISGDAQKPLKIVLNAGNGDCILEASHTISATDFLWQIRSYATRVTPMYGAYVLFLTVLMAGMTWVCCKYRKRERQGNGEVPYQELEMGITQSVSATDAADTTDGWDGVWDDDWEEDKAVRPADKQRAGNLSANGLTSRSNNKDGWDDDWDD